MTTAESGSHRDPGSEPLAPDRADAIMAPDSITPLRSPIKRRRPRATPAGAKGQYASRKRILQRTLQRCRLFPHGPVGEDPTTVAHLARLGARPAPGAARNPQGRGLVAPGRGNKRPPLDRPA